MGNIRLLNEVHNLIEKQNKDSFNHYCCKCGKGEPLSKWTVEDWDIDRYHGIEDISIIRKCPHCGMRMSF